MATCQHRTRTLEGKGENKVSPVHVSAFHRSGLLYRRRSPSRGGGFTDSTEESFRIHVGWGAATSVAKPWRGNWRKAVHLESVPESSFVHW